MEHVDNFLSFIILHGNHEDLLKLTVLNISLTDTHDYRN